MPSETPAPSRGCGCLHRPQAKHHMDYANGKDVTIEYQPSTVRQRSQSATPLRSPNSRPASRCNTPPALAAPAAAGTRLRVGSRSRSEPRLDEGRGGSGGSGACEPDGDRRSRPRAAHWSRRSPEDLARLARLRSSSRSPVPYRDPATCRTGPPRGDVGTGYGHSYSLPRPFDTTPTGARLNGMFERSRTPSQSGAPYYRTLRSRPSSGCSGCCVMSSAMSESSLYDGNFMERSSSRMEEERFVTECHMEPRCVPTGYRSTVHVKKDSTWKRFVEEVRLQRCLVPARNREADEAFDEHYETQFETQIERQSERRVDGHAERKTERHFEGHAERRVDGHAERKSERHFEGHAERHVDGHAERKSERHFEGHAERQVDGQVERKSERHSENQAERRVDGHAERQVDGHGERMSERHFERHAERRVDGHGKRQFQKRLSERQSDAAPPVARPPPPRRYRTELELWVCPERPEGRQPIAHRVQTAA